MLFPQHYPIRQRLFFFLFFSFSALSIRARTFNYRSSAFDSLTPHTFPTKKKILFSLSYSSTLLSFVPLVRLPLQSSTLHSTPLSLSPHSPLFPLWHILITNNTFSNAILSLPHASLLHPYAQTLIEHFRHRSVSSHSFSLCLDLSLFAFRVASKDSRLDSHRSILFSSVSPFSLGCLFICSHRFQ